VEVLGHSLRLNATPLSVAEIFQKQAQQQATLLDFHFGHARRRGGLRALQQGDGSERRSHSLLGSPFDYASQALLYVPKNLPDPNSEEHTRAVVAASLPVVRASGGRAFILFTTLRAMRLAHRLLREEFDGRASRFP